VVVLSEPLVDDDLGLLEAVEYLPVKEFIPEPGIEAPALAV
jgi:hypothetical protein